MLNSYWLTIPFALQIFFMALDEFRFHRERGLPRWEKIGHPLDALTVILCLTWILLRPPDHRSAAVFFGLAVFSCLFVTKDEPVHQRCCSAGEHWIHAVLFMLHPITLASAGLLWPAVWRPSTGFERVFVSAICVLMVGFGIYLSVFWNLVWRPQNQAK
jgi:hypothetical protein